MARDTAVPPPGDKALARPRGPRCGGHRREGEHRPTRPIEVAGEDVDDVDQPATDGPEFDCGRTDSAVYRRRWGGGDLAGQSADLVGGHTAGSCDGLRCEPVAPSPALVHPGAIFRASPHIPRHT